MHGRPRKPPRERDAAAAAAKVSNLRDLQSQLLHNHHHCLYTIEAISASSKLLEINPEIPTAWNYRKLALQHNLKETTDWESIKCLIDDELRLVEMALRGNPKSYGAWYHRKWVLSQGFVEADFDREFRLLDQLLKAESRNFHGWNYRRFVANLMGLPEEEVLKFTMDMININFSNYSAWHSRSELLSHLLKKKAQGFTEKEKVLAEEFEFVSQALFTDPRDQSGWFYHLWLLDQTVTPNEIALISSWPSHDSNWVLFVNRNRIYCKQSEPISNSYYVMDEGKLPIVLYFNQALKGVNSSSVTINDMLVKDEELDWRPLPNMKSQEAACWATYLPIQNMQHTDAQVYIVEVKIGYSKDILSSSGSEFCRSYFRFTLTLNSNSLMPEGGDILDELFVWNDGESSAQESNDLFSFDNLNLHEEHWSAFSNWQLETIFNEINLFKELPEENCKFVKLTLARLLFAQKAMLSNRTLTERLINSRVVLELYDDLIKLDPRHAGYYKDQRSLVLMNQVTSNKKSFSSHYSHSSDYNSSSLHRFLGFLQLRSLSLTRIGYVDRLLWVQTLDLSHNKLRSISGIEALQLLTCLNLRENHIRSLTALEPLKLLSSLRVLDISFNRIGSYLVDPTRYSFSSPLTHSSVKSGKCVPNIELASHWEAVYLFEGLRLKQLDVKGNALASDEKFRDLLMKKLLLPTLTWLDGERL